MNRLLARFPLALCLFVATLATACGDDDDSTDTGSGTDGGTDITGDPTD